MKNADKPAYPCDGQYAGRAMANNDSGLTKREVIAKDLLTALIPLSPDYTPEGIAWSCETALKYTDELLKQLEETKP